MRDLIEMFYLPILQTLQNARVTLDQAVIVGAQGIDLSLYVGYISFLGPAWTGFLLALFSCTALVLTIYIVRVAWGFYLSIKDSIQWW